MNALTVKRAPALRPLFVVAVLLVAMFVAMFTAAKPAAAATTMCSGFTACTAAPHTYTDHDWGSHYTGSYWGQYSGHNCTNYVAYYEQHVNGMSSTRPSWLLSGHNADDWASEASGAGITVSSVPVVGAVAQWGDFGWNFNSGHVGIVEKVINSNTIQVSWDTYSAGPYKWVQLNSSDANTSTAVGWPNNFIYMGGVGSGGGTGVVTNWWVPQTGDWDGDGSTTIGVYNPATATFYLSNSNTSPTANVTVAFGSGGSWVPLAGDWDGNGTTTIGVYNPATATFYLSNSNTSPTANVTVAFGSGGSWVPLAGDWDGNGTTTIGVYAPSIAAFYLSNSNTSPSTDVAVTFGSGSS